MSQTLPIENKDRSVEVFNNFEKLSKSMVQYVKSIKTPDDSIQNLRIGSVQNMIQIFLNWDSFVDSLPQSIKKIFDQTVDIKTQEGSFSISKEEFNKIIKNIPTNYEYPDKIMNEDLLIINNHIDKLVSKYDLTKGKKYSTEIREQTVQNIIKSILSSDDKKKHEEYFSKLLEEDNDKFEYIKIAQQQLSDTQEKEKVKDNYQFLIQYRQTCFKAIRTLLDQYEQALKKFVLTMQSNDKQYKQQYTKVQNLLDKFVNYKNNPENFYQIYANMKQNDLLYNMVKTQLKMEHDDKIIDLKYIDKKQLSDLFQQIKNGVLDFVNKNQGLLIQFTKDLDFINIDFSDLILNIYLNYIILIVIEQNQQTNISFTITTLKDNINIEQANTLGNIIFRLQNKQELTVKDKEVLINVYILLENDQEHLNDLKQYITESGELLQPEDSNKFLDYLTQNILFLQTIYRKYTINHRTDKILYNIIDNTIKSIYGTLILIIQRNMVNEKNIYTLLGSGRIDEVNDDCFSLYLLFQKLHNIFIQQTYQILYQSEFNETNKISPEQKQQIYNIIQIDKNSKYYDIYLYMFKNIEDYPKYFEHLNKLWNSENASTNGILPERSIKIMRDYVQELLNNLIITLQKTVPLNQENQFQIDFQKNQIITDFKGINTFNQIESKDQYESKIVTQTKPPITKDNILDIYLQMTYNIQQFTETYISQNTDQTFLNNEYKQNILKELQHKKNIYLTKSEQQANIYTDNKSKDESDKLFKRTYLINLINTDKLLDIQTGFGLYQQQFGSQYQQLKYIHTQIFQKLYNYHKTYVEFSVQDKIYTEAFNTAVQYVARNGSQLLSFYIELNNLPQFVQNELNKYDYLTTYLIQEPTILTTKILYIFLEQLETYIYQHINDINIKQIITNENNNDQSNNIYKILRMLIKLNIIQLFNENQQSGYQSLPFIIYQDDKIVVKAVITNNYYNYFQNNLPYLKQFYRRNFEDYVSAIKLLKQIPLLEIQNNKIDVSQLYKFLQDAKNEIVEIYNKQWSPYTKEEVKTTIKNQLDLSLNIQPVLEDIFNKFITLPVEYYKIIQFEEQNKDYKLLDEDNYKLKLYNFINIQQQTLGGVQGVANRTIRQKDNSETIETTNVQYPVLSCKILPKTIQKDYQLQIVSKMNTLITQVHNNISKYTQNLPKTFIETVNQNDIIRQAGILTDVSSNQTIVQLPLQSIQTPFLVTMDQLDLSVQQKQDLLNNILTKENVTNNLQEQFLTTNMIEFMKLTQNNYRSYDEIAPQTKQQYMELFENIKNQNHQLTLEDFTSIVNFDKDNMFIKYDNQKIQFNSDEIKLAKEILNNILPDNNIQSDDLIYLLYKQLNDPFVQNYNILYKLFNPDFVNINQVKVENAVKELLKIQNLQNKILYQNDIELLQWVKFDIVTSQITDSNLKQYLQGFKSNTIEQSSLYPSYDQIYRILLNLYIIEQPKNIFSNTYTYKNDDDENYKQYIIGQNTNLLQIISNARYYDIMLQIENTLEQDLNIQRIQFNNKTPKTTKPSKLTKVYIEEKQEFVNKIIAILLYQKNDIQAKNDIPKIMESILYQVKIPDIMFGKSTSSINQEVTFQQSLKYNFGYMIIMLRFNMNKLNQQLQQGLESLYIPVGGDPQNLKLVKQYSQQRYIYVKISNYQQLVDLLKQNKSTVQYIKDLYDYIQYGKQSMTIYPVNYDVYRLMLVIQCILTNKINDIQQIVNQENPIIVPLNAPHSVRNDQNATIVQTSYARALEDTISKLIQQGNYINKIPVIYNQEQSKLILFEQADIIKQIDTKQYIQMNNILALQSKSQEKTLTLVQQVQLYNDLYEIIKELKLFLITINSISQEVSSIITTYITACQNILTQLLTKLNVKTILDTLFTNTYFQVEDFVIDSQNIKFGQDQQIKNILNIIIKKDPEQFIKTLENENIPLQLIKNYAIILGLKKHENDYQYKFGNNMFYRLSFIKRITPQKRIIGQDHYYILRNSIQVFKHQTYFQEQDDNSQEKLSQDWYTILQSQQNTKSITNNYLVNFDNQQTINLNDFNICDIRQIPFMQQQTKQPYIYEAKSYSMTGTARRRLIGMSRRKYIGRGNPEQILDKPIQIQNVGNTCYAAVSMQLLLASKYTINWIQQNKPFETYKPTYNVPFDELRKEYEDVKKYPKMNIDQQILDKSMFDIIIGFKNQQYNIKQLIEYVNARWTSYGSDGKIKFTDYIYGTEQDSANFIRYILNSLKIDANKNVQNYVQQFIDKIEDNNIKQAVKQYTDKNSDNLYDIIDPFCIINIKTKTCSCGKVSYIIAREELQNSNFDESFINMLNSQYINKVENLQTFCEKCSPKQRIDHKVTTKILKLPPIFMAYSDHTKGNWENSPSIPQLQHFNVTEKIDLQDCMYSKNHNQQTQYELYSETIHGGTAKGGHYIARVKYGNQWYECSDANITPIPQLIQDEPRVQLMLFEPTKDLQTTKVQETKVQENTLQQITEQMKQLKQKYQNKEISKTDYVTQLDILEFQKMKEQEHSILQYIDDDEEESEVDYEYFETENNIQETEETEPDQNDNTNELHELQYQLSQILDEIDTIQNKYNNKQISKTEYKKKLKQLDDKYDVIVHEIEQLENKDIQINITPLQEEWSSGITISNQVPELSAEVKNQEVLIKQIKTFYIIPDHLMYEISYLAGFTNKQTLQYQNQLTFDLQVSVKSQQQQDYLASASKQFIKLRQNDMIPELRTNTIIFTYNISQNTNKTYKELRKTITSNRDIMLFNILNIQPFHPIQLIKDNQMYSILTVFGVYVDKYNQTYLQQHIIKTNNNQMKKLNVKTNYNQNIYVEYKTPQNPTDINQRTIYQDLPPIVGEQGNIITYLYQDTLIQVTYKNDQHIKTLTHLKQILNREIIEGVDLVINKIVTINKETLSKAGIQENNEINNDTVLRNIDDDNFQLIKYDSIQLFNTNDKQETKINQQNKNISNLILQIFDFINNYRKVQQNNNINQQLVQYSQYHVFSKEDE